MEQNQTDRQKLIDEAEKLLKELAEIDEPKLRHGDYGIDERGENLLIVKSEYGESPLSFNMNADHCGVICNGKHSTRDFTKLGNIFDDLKRNSEDLEATGDIYNKDHNAHACANINPDGTIYMWADNRSSYELDVAIKFHQKLEQLICTAKRKQK